MPGSQRRKKGEPPACEICATPRPVARDAWVPYQAMILAHLRSLPTIDEVREHELGRLAFFGVDWERREIALRATLEWWETVNRLDEIFGDRSPYEGAPTSRRSPSGRTVSRWQTNDREWNVTWGPDAPAQPAEPAGAS